MNEFASRFWENADFALDCFTALGAILVFGFGLLQYRRSELWKRKEFIGGELKAFLADSNTRNVLLMIDWYSRRIPFDPAATPDKWPKVDRRIQIGALEPHTLRKLDSSRSSASKRLFSDLESQIRDSYDRFLDHLEHLDAFAQAKLFDYEDLRPYLGYWIDAMTTDKGTFEDHRWRLALLTYIQYYRFAGVRRILENLTGSIGIESKIWLALAQSDPPLADLLADAVKNREQLEARVAEVASSDSVDLRVPEMDPNL